MSVRTIPTRSRTETILRWVLFVPAAIVASNVAQFLLTLMSRAFFGPRDSASVAQAIGLGLVVFVGAALFVWVGASVAPERHRKTAVTLFWVYTFLFTVVELFRAPAEFEPLSHPVRLGLAILGAIAGLSLALFQIKGRAGQAATTETEAG